MVRTLTFLIVVCFLSGSGLAQHRPGLHFLNAMDMPITPQRVKDSELEPSAVAELAQNQSIEIYMRTRCIAWLALEGSSSSFEAVVQLLRFDPEPLIKRQALIGLTRVLQLRYPDQVEGLLFELWPTLDDPLFFPALSRWSIRVSRVNHHR